MSQLCRTINLRSKREFIIASLNGREISSRPYKKKAKKNNQKAEIHKRLTCRIHHVPFHSPPLIPNANITPKWTSVNIAIPPQKTAATIQLKPPIEFCLVHAVFNRFVGSSNNGNRLLSPHFGFFYVFVWYPFKNQLIFYTRKFKTEQQRGQHTKKCE